ncbi:PKD domain-containing protein [Halosimplex marinum]|uniref:PKD domain-containing protein n=1 Tax=Halosimplex marinum TaxID=3396620 RepID=UPI003F543AFA
MLRRELLASAGAAAATSIGGAGSRVGERGRDGDAASRPSDDAGRADGTTWPQYQRDPRNTGRVPPVSALRGGVAQSWSFDTDSAAGWRRAPVVDGDTVYVAADGLYAFDREMGVKQWEFGVGEGWGYSTPAVDSGVVCSVQFEDTSAKLYGVNAADGSERWVHEVGIDPISVPVTVADGTAYVYGGSNTHAVDVSSGEHEWKVDAATAYEEGPAPAVTEDTVYVGGLTALDRSDGTEKWHYDAGGVTSPVVADGRVYVGSFQGDEYRVVGVDIAEQTGVWQATLGSDSGHRPHRSPVVVGDRVIVSADELYAFDAETGDEVWTAEDGVSSRGPATDGETVYVASGSESTLRLRAFDAADGTELWTAEYDTDDEYPGTQTPAIAGESVYLHGGAEIRALVPDNDPPVADASVEPAEPLVGEAVTLDASASTDPENAIERYEWDLGDDGTVDATGETATVEFSEPGTHAVVLTVTDAGGATDTLRTSVAVREPNEPPSPEIAVSPSTPRAGRQVTLDASASTDPDGSVSTYEWDLNGDGTTDANGRSVTHTFESAGTYGVELTVTDDDGASASATASVSVAEPTPSPAGTQPPTADAGATGPGTPGSRTGGSTAAPSEGSARGSPALSRAGASPAPSTATKSVGGALTAVVAGLLSTEALVVFGVAVVAVLIVVTWERQVE